MEENQKRLNAKIAHKKREWEENTVTTALKRFNLKYNPCHFYSPIDIPDFEFLEKVGFPGTYPFTAGTYAFYPYLAGTKGAGNIPAAHGLVRSGRYSGYGSAEEYRDYQKQMQKLGAKIGPNIAFDLPTQCGLDSDNPEAAGEVGRVGVAIDTLEDFEIIYEAFTGKMNLDQIASNFTINAPSNIIIAMYIALAEKRGISLEKIRATPQNDILKEFIGRGTYIFPPKPSMRMVRDSIAFFTEHLPHVNINSIGGYHIREAGATREQDLAYSMAIGADYLQLGIDIGLDIDSFAPKFTFNAPGGSMEFYQEIAYQRAARRMWSKLLKDQFKARNPRSMLLRQPLGAHIGPSSTTIQRPLNNLIRSVVGAMAAAMSGSAPNLFPPFDEPLGLGWSLEAIQLSEDGARILQHEAKLNEVMDPFAGSYFMESLTDRLETASWEEFQKIQEMGGATAAIESEYMQSAVARSAYERQKKIEELKELIVGVNCYTGENEVEVTINRNIPHPYDPCKRDEAEEKQCKKLKSVKKTRNNREVTKSLYQLREAAKKDEVNLFFDILNCVKAYATIQEICDTLREIFGEAKPSTAL